MALHFGSMFNLVGLQHLRSFLKHQSCQLHHQATLQWTVVRGRKEQIKMRHLCYPLHPRTLQHIGNMYCALSSLSLMCILSFWLVGSIGNCYASIVKPVWTIMILVINTSNYLDQCCLPNNVFGITVNGWIQKTCVNAQRNWLIWNLLNLSFCYEELVWEGFVGHLRTFQWPLNKTLAQSKNCILYACLVKSGRIAHLYDIILVIFMILWC